MPYIKVLKLSEHTIKNYVCSKETEKANKGYLGDFLDILFEYIKELPVLKPEEETKKRLYEMENMVISLSGDMEIKHEKCRYKGTEQKRKHPYPNTDEKLVAMALYRLCFCGETPSIISNDKHVEKLLWDSLKLLGWNNINLYDLNNEGDVYRSYSLSPGFKADSRVSDKTRNMAKSIAYNLYAKK